MRSLYKHAFAAIALMSVNCYSAVYKDSQKWPDTTITYRYSTDSGEALAVSDPERQALEAAMTYYRDNTAFDFVEVTSGQNILFRKDTDGDGRSDANVGRDCFYWNMSICQVSSVDMASSVGQTSEEVKQTAIHELYHSLAFRHEQIRQDRQIELAPGSPASSNSDDWGVSTSWYNKAIGNFDFASISLYSGGLDVAATLDDSRRILDILSKPATFERQFRILVPDSTETNFDNMFLNNQTNASLLEVSNHPSGYHSPVWDFIYLGGGDQFFIKNKWQGTYLQNDGSSIPALTTSGSSSSKTWTLEKTSTGFKVYNDSTGIKKYLQHNLGGVSLSSSSSTSSALWGVQVVSAFVRDGLSDMDKVALHQVYGHLFRIQVSDSTPQRTDNMTLNVQNHSSGDVVDAFVLPLTNNHNSWHSAMWHLERVGTFFRIKNLWTQEYIHMESGLDVIERDEEGTINSQGHEIKTWFTGHWDLEIDYSDGGFRVNNRQNGQFLKLNSDGTIGATIDPDEATRFDFAPVNWVDM